MVKVQEEARMERKPYLTKQELRKAVWAAEYCWYLTETLLHVERDVPRKENDNDVAFHRAGGAGLAL